MCALHAIRVLAFVGFIALLTIPSAAQTGVQVNVDENGENIPGDAANEPTIAVSPLDPQVMVIGWRQFDTVTSDKRFAGYGYTADGGQSWTADVLDTPPNQPPGSGQSDPVLSVDAEGLFYYWSEVFEPTPNTAHYVYRSFDQGVSWTVPVQVEDPAVDGDKPWLVIDRTRGIGQGHLYGGWTGFQGPNYMVFTRSTDGGLSFSPPVRIADLDGYQFMLHFGGGPDGELYAAWRHYNSNSIFVTKSINAQDPEVEPTFDGLGAGGENGLDVWIDDGNDPGFLPINPVGFHQIWIEVDISDGPRRGWVYCVWADDRHDVCDINFARSMDGGFTWESGIRVNDDPVGNGAYQWMVAMDVAPSGRIDVVWYDTRDDPGNFESSLYYSFSADGGDSWSANRRLSDSFDTTVGFPMQEKIGDYTQIISLDDAVNIAYAATHNGEQDVWFMRLPSFVKGDLNCDGQVDFGDINPFVLRLTDPAGYAAAYPDCPDENADINGDGEVDFGDINPFVAMLSG